MFLQEWGKLFVHASTVIRHKTRQTQTYLPGTASCAASSRSSPPLASVFSTKRKSKAWGAKGSCHGITLLKQLRSLGGQRDAEWLVILSKFPVLSGRLPCCVKSAYRVLLSNASFFPRRKSRTQSGKWIAASEPRKHCSKNVTTLLSCFTVADFVWNFFMLRLQRCPALQARCIHWPATSDLRRS